MYMIRYNNISRSPYTSCDKTTPCPKSGGSRPPTPQDWRSYLCSSTLLSLFIHSGNFYSASSSPLLRGAPDHTTDTVSEFTRRSATGYCKWRTCPRSIRVG